ncbi:unnamed protein product [Owenia fusiformis]|uniref:Uncharacterized protein n=1 Tax=Owenia fusiformis TaxID=6347 RepID=A0A8J1TUM0_OWEFU|nr:unnamed protein product [Owenia fusiformis]
MEQEEMETENQNQTPLGTVQDAVECLYTFRDHYFENHSLEEAANKTEKVAKQLKETLNILETHQGSIENKAQYCMLRGKALNVLPSYSAEALELLSKAVKLDPKMVEAWNNLGETYWKKGDIAAAKNCFSGALEHSKNKISLRNLSMVLRQLGKDQEERLKYTEESVEFAKSAIELDIKDGTSWFIMGNAYLSLFFGSNQLPKVLKQCMSAYNQAEKDIVASCNPDLHFNRAIAYKYMEEYQLALVGFSRAAALDPTWGEPMEKHNKLLEYLATIQDYTHKKGKLKGKKLETMLKSLKGDQDLGAYQGGSYKGPKGQTVKLEKTFLKNLKPELNSEKVIIGKVVCSFTSDDPVPFSFCFVDEEETCFPVNVYNVAPGYGVKIGDSVAIPEPFVQLVDVKVGEQAFQFKSIRVDSPVVLVVNGRKLGLDKQAPSQLSVSAKSE